MWVCYEPDETSCEKGWRETLDDKRPIRRRISCEEVWRGGSCLYNVNHWRWGKSCRLSEFVCADFFYAELDVPCTVSRRAVDSGGSKIDAMFRNKDKDWQIFRLSCNKNGFSMASVISSRTRAEKKRSRVRSRRQEQQCAIHFAKRYRAYRIRNFLPIRFYWCVSSLIQSDWSEHCILASLCFRKPRNIEQ